MASSPFRCKKFEVDQTGVAHPVGTDGMLLGAWADVRGATRLLDIGTGTGLLPLMLAQRSHPTDAPIHAVEIHPPSARCAERNLAASEWAARYRVVEMSIQQYAQVADNQYDLIVSNPPFFSETTMSPDATRRVGRSMGDALSLSDLLDSVVRLLAPRGRFCVVLPVAEGRFLKEMAATRGLYWTRECAVYARVGRPAERLLLQLERDPYHVERSTLVVYEQGTTYTEAYATWMRDFLL